LGFVQQERKNEGVGVGVVRERVLDFAYKEDDDKEE
jgi:hypothetical protein